jgi:hypothetical protein
VKRLFFSVLTGGGGFGSSSSTLSSFLSFEFFANEANVPFRSLIV